MEMKMKALVARPTWKIWRLFCEWKWNRRLPYTRIVEYRYKSVSCRPYYDNANADAQSQTLKIGRHHLLLI